MYTKQETETMRVAENSRLPGGNRVEEIKNFARNAGLIRIGIANCIAMQKEATQLKSMLENDFEVFTVDCKHGKIPASELLGNDAKGISCNPAGQAKYLAENKTDLNIVLGLCIGHDIIFNQRSASPVTTLLVKDRENRHNSMKIFNQNM